MAPTDRSPVTKLELAPGREAEPGPCPATRLILVVLGCAALIGLGAAQAHASERPHALDRIKIAAGRPGLPGALTGAGAANARRARAHQTLERIRARARRAALAGAGRHHRRRAPDPLDRVRFDASPATGAGHQRRAPNTTDRVRFDAHPATVADAATRHAATVPSGRRQQTTAGQARSRRSGTTTTTRPAGLVPALTGTVVGGLVKPLLATVAAVPAVAVNIVRPVTGALLPALDRITGSLTGIRLTAASAPDVGGITHQAPAQAVAARPSSTASAEAAAPASGRTGRPAVCGCAGAARRSGWSQPLLAVHSQAPSGPSALGAPAHRHLPPVPARDQAPSGPMSSGDASGGGSSAAAGLFGVLTSAALTITLRRGRRSAPGHTSGAAWGLRPPALPG